VIEKISIVIATKNSAKTLQACLNSIFEQAYANIEIVIFDGASDDETIQILKENDSKIDFWLSEPDEGLYYAFNKALDKLTGDWVLFLGSDDLLLPGFSQMAQELTGRSTIYYGNVLYKGRKSSGYMSAYKIAKSGMSHQSMFYSSDIFKRHRYNLDYKISADSILNLDCWSDKSIKWIYKDHIIAIYNDTGLSATNFDQLLLKNMSGLVLKHFGRGIWLRYKFRELKKNLKMFFKN